MSLAEARRFHQKLEADVEFFEGLYRELQMLDPRFHDQTIALFARRNGFDFSSEDYKSLAGKFAGPDSGRDRFDCRRAAGEREKNAGVLERAFIWLSGSSPSMLATCPESEQKKHAALGGAVLVPALLALITVPFFLHTLNFRPAVIAPAAVLWSAMILLMDRALLASYRNGLSLTGKIGQLALRFGIALLIAVAISHPIVLLLFGERIDAVYRADRIRPELTNLALQCDLKKPRSDISLLDQKIIAARDGLSQAANLAEPAACGKKTAMPEVFQTEALETLMQSLQSLKAKQLLADQEVALFIENAEKEKQGLGASGFTGIRGCPKESQCKKWLYQAGVRKDDSLRLGKEIIALEKEIHELGQRAADQFLEARQSESRQCGLERDALKKVRIRQHEIDQQGLSALYDQREALQRRCQDEQTRIAGLRPDLLTQTEILSGLMFPDNRISWHHFSVFLVFMLLFLIVDMLAVVLKISGSGVYEAKVDIAEGHNKLTYLLSSRQQLIAQLAHLENSRNPEAADRQQAGFLQKALDENLNSIIRSYAKSDRKKISGYF